MREYGFHAPALHIMIEAKKLAYADMLRYVGDPRFPDPGRELARGTRRASQADRFPTRSCERCRRVAASSRVGGETIYLAVIDQDGNIVSLIQSNLRRVRFWPGRAGHRLRTAESRRPVHARPRHPNTLAPHKRPLHTLIPAFMEKDSVRIGFGIMGGWNQAQAHAQFVANIADFDLHDPGSARSGPLHQARLPGCGVEIEALVPDATRAALEQLGHKVVVVPARSSGDFGYGQAVMSTPEGAHFGPPTRATMAQRIPEGVPIGR